MTTPASTATTSGGVLELAATPQRTASCPSPASIANRSAPAAGLDATAARGQLSSSVANNPSTAPDADAFPAAAPRTCMPREELSDF